VPIDSSFSNPAEEEKEEEEEEEEDVTLEKCLGSCRWRSIKLVYVRLVKKPAILSA
jgi:hypothetical protein